VDSRMRARAFGEQAIGPPGGTNAAPLAIYKKPPSLISSGRQSSPALRVSKRSFLVIGEYSPEFNEITYTFTIKD